MCERDRLYYCIIRVRRVFRGSVLNDIRKRPTSLCASHETLRNRFENYPSHDFTRSEWRGGVKVDFSDAGRRVGWKKSKFSLLESSTRFLGTVTVSSRRISDTTRRGRDFFFLMLSTRFDRETGSRTHQTVEHLDELRENRTVRA